MRSLRSHPEYLAIAIAAVAWTEIVVSAALSHRTACCGPHPSILAELGAWCTMVAAMMLPTIVASLRDVSARSYRVRRVRAVLACIAGYLVCWLAAGVPLLALRPFGLAQHRWWMVALCGAAALWPLLPRRARWWRSCHRTIPLCPVGRRADYDAARQGIVIGRPCVAMCWPLMAICALTGHNIFVMIGGTVLALVERRMFRLERGRLFVGTLFVSLLVVAIMAPAAT